MGEIILIIIVIIIAICIIIAINDRFFQNKNLVLWNFPLVWRVRYISHTLRPFIRQYFLDDNDFTNRIVIDWILNVSSWKSWYFSFDKFDSTSKLHSWENQMIHSSTPFNYDEMEVKYPTIWEKRKYPFTFNSYIYRSGMSLWSIGFEATSAMAAACSDTKAPFNTWEWWFSVHHIPRVKFKKERKFFKYKKIPKIYKILYALAPWPRLKNYVLELLWSILLEKWKKDLYLFCKEEFLFYTIDWKAPLEHFPKYEELTSEFWNIIFQIWSGLYWLKKHTGDRTIKFNWDRFKKVMSFCKAVEIKLAQWAKQSWWVLKAVKNTPTIAEIRWVEPYKDLIAPNRFPFYDKWKEKEFFEFIEKLSEKASSKPVWIKVVISDKSNIEPIIKEIAKNPKVWPDFITIDWWDWWSATAPMYLSVLFWKKIYEALKIVDKTLIEYKVRDKLKIFTAAKLYAPYMSARALALWADAIGNGRSIMIAGWCVRAWLCSWEYWDCPVWLTTMKKSKTRAYKQAWNKKVEQISNFIKAHNEGIIRISAIAWVKSPDLLWKEHIAK